MSEIKGESAKDGMSTATTSLLCAASEGNKVYAKRYLKCKDIDFQARDKNGLTALILVCKHNWAEIVKEFVALGADIDATSASGRTALHYASEHGHLETVKELLKHKGSMLADKEKYSPLCCAALMGHDHVLQYLIDNSAPHNFITRALMMAACVGKQSIMDALFARGLDADAEDDAQQTPLHWAAAGGQDAIVTSLLARGARVDHTCKNGKTALIRAATNGECESIKLLCTHGANISHQDNDARNALFHALQQGQLTAVLLLMSLGSDIHVPNKDVMDTLAKVLAAAQEFQKMPPITPPTTAKTQAAGKAKKASFATTTKKAPVTPTTATLTASLNPDKEKDARRNPIGDTWLGKLLILTNVSTHWVKICERVLVKEQHFDTLESFGCTPREYFTARYLNSVGITPLGLQTFLLQLHKRTRAIYQEAVAAMEATATAATAGAGTSTDTPIPANQAPVPSTDCAATDQKETAPVQRSMAASMALSVAVVSGCPVSGSDGGTCPAPPSEPLIGHPLTTATDNAIEAAIDRCTGPVSEPVPVPETVPKDAAVILMVRELASQPLRASSLLEPTPSDPVGNFLGTEASAIITVPQHKDPTTEQQNKNAKAPDVLHCFTVSTGDEGPQLQTTVPVHTALACCTDMPTNE